MFAASIGSTTVGTGSEFLVETVDSDDGSDDEMSDGDEDPSCGDLFGDDIDLDGLLEQAFVGSTTAAKPQGVLVEHLSKIWRIDLKTAKKTLDVTTQLLRRSEDTALSRN